MCKTPQIIILAKSEVDTNLGKWATETLLLINVNFINIIKMKLDIKKLGEEIFFNCS